jgi:hypothetical protein
MTGTITATAGNIGDWIIKDGKLSGSNATLDATGAALYMSDKGPDTDSSATFDIQRDEYYIDFTPADQGNTTNYFVKFGPNFAVDSSGILVASGAIFEGQITASTGQIGGADIGDSSLEYSPYWRISSSADTTDPASFISSSRFKVSAGGNITGSQVLFTGGKIGGFILGASSLQNIENTVELSSTLPGLSIKDAAGVARVQVKSGSLSTVGGGTQYIGNRSFEDDTISAGRNIRSGSNILSWSFAMGGHSSASLTDRSGYADDDKAVSGDVTLDVVVPAGSGNYSSVNTYELSQIITASISAGDTLSFSSVARFSSSFGGKGKDRALGPQYFRAEYSSSTGWIPFLPTANFTASNGYGEYFLGSGQYNSFGASAELPVAVEYVKLVLTGSINDDTGFSIKKPLYVGAKGTVDASLSDKTFTKTVVGSTTAAYPETEITFDNFSVRSNTRKVELSEEGILIYNSEDSFFKMDAAGIEYRGGSGVSTFGSSISRESFTNDSQVAGTLGAPSLQAYVGDPEAIGTTASDGNVGDYSKGNHIHIIAGSTINSVLSGTTLTNGIWNSTFGATANTLISGSWKGNGAIDISSDTNLAGGTGITLTGDTLSTTDSEIVHDSLSGFVGDEHIDHSGVTLTAGVGLTGGGDITTGRTFDVDFSDSTLQSAISGSLGSNATLIRTLTAVGISGSFTTVSSSLAARLTSEEGEAEGSVISSSAQIATDISGSWQGSIDISSDTNLVGGTGITLTGDTLSTTDSEIAHDSLSGFVANEHIDHTTVSISAGGILSGGGTIVSNRTITLASSDVVHDSTTGFVANEHIDHSGVTLTAGTGLSGGGDITTNRTFAVDFSDSTLATQISGSWGGYITGSGIVSSSAFSSPSQGTVRATINGIETNVDTGLQTGDTPTFSTLIATNDVYAQGLYVSSSASTNVIQVGADGSGGIQKWEWHRDGTRRWLIYNDGRTNQAPIPQDSMVFKHGISTDGADHINFHMEQDDQTVYFHGDISGSGNLYITGNVTASGNISGSSTSTGSFGTIQIGGKQVYGDATGIGIGISDPADILHLSDGTAETRLQIENTGTGDPILMLQTDGLKNWYMGIDRSDSHKLHWHSTGGAWDPDNAQMALSLEGDLTLSGSFESQFGNISGSSISTGSFGRVEGRTDFTTIDIDDDEIPIAKLAQDAVTITAGDGLKTGGSVTLGSSVTLDVDLNELTTETTIAQADFVTMVDATDDGSGKITFSNLEDEIFGNVSGDILIAAGGAATIQADSVALTTDTTGNYVQKVTVGTGLGGAVDSEGGTAAMTLDAAQTVITSLLATDIKIGEDDQTKIDFETADTINFYAGNENQLVLTDGYLTPSSNAIVDLGTDALEFKDLWIDGTANIDSLVADTADINAGTVDAITSLTVANDVDVGNFKITSKALEASDLTATQVVFAGANGLLATDSDLTFATDTLTATKIGAFQAAGSINFDNQDMTNVDIDSGDIASGVTINKSPVITLGGDLDGNVTLTNLASGTLTATIVADSVEGTMLHTNTADTSTLELSSDTLSVLKVPNALTAGLGLSTSTSGTFDGAAAITFAIDSAEFSTVTPANGDLLLTLDSDGSTQQNTAISELATLYSGTGLTATNSVIAVDYGTSAGNAAEGDNTLTLTGASNEITIDVGSGAQAIGSNTAITIGLADTIGGARTFSDDIILSDGEGITNSAYNSGFAGSGWNIDYGITEGGKGSAEFDNLTIRGTMSVYELLIHQVRATNGSIWVSNTGKIESSSFGAGAVGERTYTLFFSSGSGAGHGFRNADSIRAQRWSPTGDLYRSDLFVLSTDIDADGTGSLTATLSGSSDEPVAGMDYVRIGNISGSASSSRQGAIYLTSDDSNAPYIDVVDGVTHHGTFNTSGNIKTRMGKLSGITSPTMGALSGYGFYASGSAYLEGKINATAGGKIAGWEISSSFLGKSTISLNSDVPSLRISDATRERLRVGDLNGVGGYSSTQFGIIGFDGTGTTASEVLFELSDNRNVIADWAIAPGSIQYDSSGGSLALAANSQSISIFTGSLDFARPKISLGKLPNLSGDANLDRYGLAVFTGTVDADITDDKTYTVLITKDKARLAGWDLIPGNIQSDNTDGSVRLSSISQSLTIWTGSVDEAQPKLVLGKLPLHDGTVDSPYGFAVFSGTGTVSGSQDSASVLITANKARLAGWDLTPGKLSSGTVASIDGNNASIALGTGATTATGTPTDGLFFVSASTSPVFYVGSNFSYVDDVLTAGGWKIGNGIISSSISADTDGVILDATNKVLTFHGADGKDSFHTGRDNVRLAVGQVASGIYGMIGYDGSGNTLLELSETQAKIAGFYFSNNDLWGGNSAIGNSATTIVMGGLDGTSKIALGATADNLSMTAGTGFYADGGGNFKAGTANGYGIFWDASTLQISSSEFYLGDATNYISGSGGAITVAADTFDLKTTYMRVSSSYGGTIAMGKTIPTSISGSGIFLSGSGDFLAGNHAGNKIQYAQGPGAIVMKSSTFSLDATTIVIDSSANDGKIALGASPNTSVAGTNAGIYMDGQGDFLVYGSATNFLKFDQSDGSIDMKSDTFGLGTATMVISSSVNSGTVRLGSNGGPISYNANSSGIYMDGTGKFQVYGDSDNYLRWDGSDFTIKGDLTVDNIRTPATIGGSPSTILNASASITAQGYARFVSASIGGWDVNETTLTGGVVTLNSAGSIEVGGLADATTTATTNSGFFADSSGNVLIKGNVSGNDYLKISAGGSIDIKSQVFDLDAGTVVIDSATNSGKIALGSTPPTSVDYTSNAGIYMDGTGDFLAYGDGDNFIKKDGAALTIKSELFTLDAGELYITDAVSNGMIGMGSDGSAMSLTAGTGFYADGGGDFRVGRDKGVGISFDSSAGLLVMSSSAFLLGTSGSLGHTGAYVSGSNGILSISSSNFFLAPAGDVTMQGKVTATTGAIGGWDIGTDSLTSTNIGLHSAGYSEGAELLIGHATAYASADIGFKADGSGKLAAGNITWDTSGHITFGDVSTENVYIASEGVLQFRDGTTVKGELNASTWTIGGTDGTTADAVVVAAGGVKIYDTTYNYSHISPDGLKIYRDVSSAAKLVAQFGSEIDLYSEEATPLKYVNIASDGVSIGKNADGGAAVINTVRLPSGGDVYLYGDHTSTYSKMSSAGLQVYKNGAGDSGLVATYGSNTTLTGGTITIQGTTGAVGHDKLVIGSATLSMTANQSKVLDIVDGKINIGPAAVGGTAVTGNVRVESGNVYLYGDNTSTYSKMSSAGLQVYSNGSGDSGLVATYGANTLITGGTITLQGTTGTIGHDKIVLGSASIAMYTNNAKVLDMVDGKLNIGPAAVGGTAVVGNVRVEADAVYLYGDHTSTYSKMTGDGLQVYKNGAGDSGLVATYGTNATLTGGTVTLQGTTGAVGHDKLVLGSGTISMTANQAKVFDMVDGKLNIGPAAVGGTAVTGNVRVEADAVYFYGDHTSTYSKMTTAGLQVYKNGAGDSGLVATYGANTLITGGTITLQGTTGTIGHDKLVLGSASIAMYTNNAKVFDMVDGKLNIGPAAVGGTAVTGNVRVEADAVYLYGDNTSTYSKMSSAGLQVYSNGAGDSGLVATYGANALITGGSITLQGTTGTLGHERLVLEDNSISLYVNNAEVFDVTGGVVTVGSSTDQVEINGTSGITIRENDIDTITLSGGAVIVGEVGASKSNVQITSGGINLRTDTTTKMSLSSAGAIAIGSNFTVDSSGNVGVAGDIKTATSGQRIHLDSTNNRLDFYNSSANVVRIGEEIFGYSGNPDGIKLSNGGRLYGFSSIDDADTNTGYPIARLTYNLAGGGDGTFGSTERVSIEGRMQADFYSGLADDATSTAHTAAIKGRASIGGHEEQSGVRQWAPKSYGIWGELRYTGNGASEVELMNSTVHSAIYGNVVISGATVTETSGNYYSGYFTGGPAYFGGRVGIGDTTPDYPLDVEGQVSNISIYAEYDIAAYSDIRVKTDIETITEPLNKVLKMRGVTFRRIDSDLDKRQMGVIAQEVEPYVPEVVSTVEDESSDKYGHKSVSYGNLTALLIEAIKEQQEQIEELKQQVKEIKDANHG